MPEVDVVKDWLDYTNLVVGLGGLTAALVAILLARRAQRSADVGITEERRRLFELEILRELMRDLDETSLVAEAYWNPRVLEMYDLRLGLLTCRLSMWDAVMGSDGTAELLGLAGLDSRHRELKATGEALSKADAKILARDGEWTHDEAWQARTKVKSDMQLNRSALGDLHAEGHAWLRDRLAWDVREAIQARVRAGEQPRLSRSKRWWYSV
ncbi:hypothetical protein [Actinoplanes sp. NPDC026670]|uniref:hypothetical protein n=1 Tax=Actinoplanes sp. NPDC026670 TaxID=3154700 RepID=UPI0033E79D0F